MIKKLLPILFVLIITSCSKEVPEDRLVERNGMKYEVNSQTPFSGTSFNNENGQLNWRINFKDGKEDGLTEAYFENGELESISCFKNGDSINMSYCE